MGEVGAEIERLRQAAGAEAAAKAAAEKAFRLTELADLLRDVASDDDALMEAFAKVENATGKTVEEIDWWRTASGAYADRIYYCPPLGGWSSVISVDGTDRYYAPSQICNAAVHAGALTFEGGFVRLRFYAEDANFQAVASSRNGITSDAYGWQHMRTFSFVPVLQ
jgi:hypothetical protein